jgi:hypothetical protein
VVVVAFNDVPFIPNLMKISKYSVDEKGGHTQEDGDTISLIVSSVK